jgi:tRNA-dihydrouridine synthase
MIHDAGANHVILHARPAILSLNPVKNRVIPTLDYSVVKCIASDFHDKVKITMNGGISSLHQLSTLQMKQQNANTNNNKDQNDIYSHMAGRWCLRRPLDLIAIEKTLYHNDELVDTIISHQTQKDHLRMIIDSYITYASSNLLKYSMAELCLPLFLVVEQLREDYNNDDDDLILLSNEDMEDVYFTIQDGLHDLIGKGGNKHNFAAPTYSHDESSLVNFNKLSSSFKVLAGTKVVNKWKRNRSELL